MDSIKRTMRDTNRATLKFEFKASNCQAEYKDIIVIMVLALETGASKLKAKNDSQLVSNQVVGEHQAEEPQLMKYLHKVRSLSACFKSFEVKYVPNKQNSRVDLLSKLATTKTARCNQTVLQETLVAPNIKADKIYTLEVAPDSS